MQAKGKERDNKIQKDFNEWGTFNIYHAPFNTIHRIMYL